MKWISTITIPQDKANHFIYSLLLCTVLYTLGVYVRNIYNAQYNNGDVAVYVCYIAFIITSFKEAVDYISESGTCSWWDVFANLLGIHTFLWMVWFTLNY